jgi:hypothetical protein
LSTFHPVKHAHVDAVVGVHQPVVTKGRQSLPAIMQDARMIAGGVQKSREAEIPADLTAVSQERFDPFIRGHSAGP